MRNKLLSFKQLIECLRKRTLPRPSYPGDTDRYSYQSLYHRFDITPGAKVLDVGSGAYPFPYATILGDRFLEKTKHRHEELVRDSRPFVFFDLQSLPFPDKSIDYVYCSHVLEHVDDPVRCCHELMRVGKAGFIETPSSAKDILFSWARDMHKWHVVSINDWLLFFEYTDRQASGIGSSAWRDMIFSDTYNDLQAAFYHNQDLFNVMLAWVANFNVMVFRLNADPEVLISKGQLAFSHP